MLTKAIYVYYSIFHEEHGESISVTIFTSDQSECSTYWYMAGNGKNIILWYTSCCPHGKSGNSEGLVSIKYSNCFVTIIVSHLVHLRHMHVSIVKIPAQSFTCELHGILSHYHNLWLLLPLANLYVVYFYSHRKDYFVPLQIHCSFT